MASKAGDDVARQIVGETLDGYLGERSGDEARDVLEVFEMEEPGVGWGGGDVAAWREAVKTPSVFSRAKVDETLRRMRAKADCSGVSGARFSEDEWAEVVDTVNRYLLDVVEGCGFIVRSAEHIEEIKRSVDETLRGMIYLDEEAGRFRDVVVSKEVKDG